MSDDGRAGGRRADRTTNAPGRRAGGRPGRRLDVVIVLAMLLPTVIALALGLTRGDDLPDLDTLAPTPARLTSASLVCPAGEGDVLVGRVPGTDTAYVDLRVGPADPDDAEVDGPATVRGLAADDPAAVGPDRVATVPAEGAAVSVVGQDAGAPGLVGGRTSPTAPPECRGPAYDEWFVGLSAAARNSSVVELANPEAGPAVVDIAVFGPTGELEAPELRGITVAGRTVTSIDLATAIPRRVDLAAHVTVTRGRVVASVRQAHDSLGRSTVSDDWLLSQAEAATENLLLGLPTTGTRGLYVMNPGDDELRARLRVVTEEAAFEPAGTREVVVPPHSLRRVNLATALPADAADGALGLLVESSAPALVSARVFVDDDIALFTPATHVSEPVVSLLPTGPKRLLLAGAESSGTVRVLARSADGRTVADERVEIGQGRVASLDLPEDALSVTVEARGTPIVGTVLTTGDGLGVLRLREAAVYADVPVVVPE